MIPIEKVLEERKSVSLISNSDEKYSKEFSKKYNQLMPCKEKLIMDL